MKTYKIILALLSVIFIYYDSYGQTCEPHPDGYYMYYANLNLEAVPNEFSKTDFISLLNNSDKLSENELTYLNSTILKIEKSFPTSVTEYLQHSITIYSTKKNLEPLLSKSTEQINIVNFVCFPKEMSLYESNDYNNVSSWIGGDTYHDLIRTNEAWGINRGDSRILIGITDTHLNENHEDLINKIDSIIQNSAPIIDTNSISWHGTSVAGCAAAETNNQIGSASVSYKSNIVFSSSWANDNTVLQIAQIPEVRVINLSWVNSCNSVPQTDSLYEAIRDIHNTVVVAGAGNNDNHCGWNNPVFPASYESVISVSSVGHSFNRGTTYTAPDGTYWGEFLWKDCHDVIIGGDSETGNHHHNEFVNICAPGYNVYTTHTSYWDDEAQAPPTSILTNEYADASGTSFASPIVASACALVASVNPCLTAAEIQDIVLNTADPSIYLIPENQDYIGQLGTGRLDVYEAVKRALDLSTIYIQNQTYNGVTTTESSLTALYAGYNVTNTQAFGLVSILPSSEVTFEATNSIVLSDGFEVKNDAFFEAVIVESPCIE